MTSRENANTVGDSKIPLSAIDGTRGQKVSMNM